MGTTAHIQLTDSEGKSEVDLLSGEGRAGLTLSDAEGTVRAGLTVAEDGTSGLAFFDSNAQTRTVLANRKDGAVLKLYDTCGEKVWSAP